jgi:hypothetical protein
MTLFAPPHSATPAYTTGFSEVPDADMYDPPPEQFTRPRALRLLAIVDVLVGLAAAATALITAAALPDVDDAARVLLLALVSGVSTLLAVLCFVAAIGIRRLTPFGRLAQIGASALWLLSFPLGTLAGGFVLHYLMQPGVRLLFSGRPPASMSLAERAIVVRDRRGPVLVPILYVVLGVAAIAAIGILAAVAAAGLTRARAGANEASAIGRMRAMASGQAAYSSSRRGAYGRVECLVLPALCAPEGSEVSSPYLSADMIASERSGYTFRFQLSEDRQRFTYWGQPIEPGATGSRAFCVTQELDILTYPARHPAPGSADGCPPGGTPLQ